MAVIDGRRRRRDYETRWILLSGLFALPSELSDGPGTRCLCEAQSSPRSTDGCARYPSAAALGARDVVEVDWRPARKNSTERAHHRRFRARRISCRESRLREPPAAFHQRQLVCADRRQAAFSGCSFSNGTFGERQGLCKLSEMLPGAGAAWIHGARLRSNGTGRAHWVSG